jgi:hypothetical protein
LLSGSRPRIEKDAFDFYSGQTHVGIPAAAGRAREAKRPNCIGFIDRRFARHD